MRSHLPNGRVSGKRRTSERRGECIAHAVPALGNCCSIVAVFLTESRNLSAIAGVASRQRRFHRRSISRSAAGEKRLPEFTMRAWPFDEGRGGTFPISQGSSRWVHQNRDLPGRDAQAPLLLPRYHRQQGAHRPYDPAGSYFLVSQCFRRWSR